MIRLNLANKPSKLVTNAVVLAVGWFSLEVDDKFLKVYNFFLEVDRKFLKLVDFFLEVNGKFLKVCDLFPAVFSPIPPAAV